MPIGFTELTPDNAAIALVQGKAEGFFRLDENNEAVCQIHWPKGAALLLDRFPDIERREA